MGLFCQHKSKWWKTKSKGSYVPKFALRSAIGSCDRGEAKIAGLCYDSCEQFNMVNCGGWACASSKDQCTESIIDIAQDTLEGAADAALFVASFGTSSAAVAGKKAALKSALKEMGQTALENAAEHAADTLKNNNLVRQAAYAGAYSYLTQEL